MASYEFFRCGSLWAVDCNELVAARTGFRCRDTTHTFGPMGELIRDAINAGIPVEELIKLHGDPMLIVLEDETISFVAQYRPGRAILAACPNVDGETLAKIVSVRELHATYSVSANLSAPPQLLAELASLTDMVVRSNVATNRSTPSSVLEVLVTDRDPNVRAALAINPVLPTHLSFELAVDKSAMVRIALSTNRDIVAEVIGMLSRCVAFEERIGAATHPNLKYEDARYLANDSDWRVRSALGANWSGTNDLLIILAKDPNPGVRSSVASNTRISPELFESLSLDVEYSVRYKLALNPSLPWDVYAYLAYDTHTGVRKNLSKNISSPSRYSVVELRQFIVTNPKFAWLALYSPLDFDDDISDIVFESCRGMDLILDDFSAMSNRKLEMMVSSFIAGQISFGEESRLSLLRLVCRELGDSPWSSLFCEYILSRSSPNLINHAVAILKSQGSFPIDLTPYLV